MRVEHRCIERRNKEIKISDHDGHCTIDDAIGAVDEALWLVCEPCRHITRVRSDCERAVSQVELLTPTNELGSASRSGSDVAVVGSDSLAWAVPAQ